MARQSYDDEEFYDGPYGYPLAATLICVAVLITGLVLVPIHATFGTAALGYAAAIGAAGVVLWAIAYAITIKHADKGWKIWSAVALVTLGLLGGLLKVGAANLAMRNQGAHEIASQMETILNTSDPASVKLSSGRSVYAQILSAVVNPELEDDRKFKEEVQASGAPQAMSFAELSHGSAVLDHCDRIEALVGRTDYYRGRWDFYKTSARAVTDKALASHQIGETDATAILRSMDTGRAPFERKMTLLAQVAHETATICTILARRHWIQKNGVVLFSNARDLTETRAHQSTARTAQAELASIQERARETDRADIVRLEQLGPDSNP